MSESIIYITPVNKDEKYAIPSRGTPGSAGFDFTYFGEQVLIKPGEIKMFNLNLKTALPQNMVLIFKTRSSMAKKNLMVAGGVIDSDYRGPISCMITNIGLVDQIISSESKICQGIILELPTISFQYSEYLNKTERNEGGFGSTGI